MSRKQLEQERDSLIRTINVIKALPPLDQLEEELDEVNWLLRRRVVVTDGTAVQPEPSD